MFNEQTSTARYRIKSVANITGLSTHLIRKWEKRYSLFHLERGANGYRTFTEEDIQFLLYLKHQLDKGQTIGQLAQTGRDDLRKSMNRLGLDDSILPGHVRQDAKALIQAARKNDVKTVKTHLSNWITQLGLAEALASIIFPLLQVVGDLWHKGGISISGEHHISQLVRQYILISIQEVPTSGTIPALVACVPGDYHEIGPLATTLVLQNNGWHSTYLGPNMSFEVLQMALRRRHAQLMILSCILEPAPDTVKSWIRTIVQDIQPLCQVMVGGEGFSRYAQELETHHIHYLRTIDEVKSIEVPQQTALHYDIKAGHNNHTAVSS